MRFSAAEYKRRRQEKPTLDVRDKVAEQEKKLFDETCNEYLKIRGIKCQSVVAGNLS